MAEMTNTLRQGRAVRTLVALAALTALQACSLTPVYQRPEPAVPANLAGVDAASAPASAASSLPPKTTGQISNRLIRLWPTLA